MKKNKYKIVKKWLIVILFTNLLVALLKMIIGQITKSASITADGFHSLSDGASNIVGLIGVSFASKNEDKNHPYGHSKYENLAGLFISIMLLFTSYKIIASAISRLIEPVLLELNTYSLIILIITLIINITVAFLEYKKGKELNSQILITDSMHTRSDIYISLGILISLIGIKLGLPPIIDPIASLVVAFVIILAAYRIYKDNSNVLLDGAALDPKEIKKVISNFDEVKGVSKIKSRYNINQIIIELHILVDSNINISSSHELVHKIEDELKNTFNNKIQLITHIEPFK